MRAGCCRPDGVDHLFDGFEHGPSCRESACCAAGNFIIGNRKSSTTAPSTAAVTKSSKHATEADAFLQYLYTPAAQRLFADNGYRPVISGVAKADEFKDPAVLFTIKDLGGWSDVTTKFFDPDKGIVAGIEKGIGVSTSK